MYGVRFPTTPIYENIQQTHKRTQPTTNKETQTHTKNKTRICNPKNNQRNHILLRMLQHTQRSNNNRTQTIQTQIHTTTKPTKQPPERNRIHTMATTTTRQILKRIEG